MKFFPSKEVVKKFLQDMKAQRNIKTKISAIYSNFPIEGAPNVTIEDYSPEGVRNDQGLYIFKL